VGRALHHHESPRHLPPPSPFAAILLGMLVGLSMLSQAIQPHLERLVLWALLYVTRDAQRLGRVVSKALVGHRPRNSKTSYLLAIVIGFLVFASSMFGLQAESITTNVRMFLGADVVALIPDGIGVSNTPGTVTSLPQSDLTTYLQGVMVRGGPGVCAHACGCWSLCMPRCCRRPPCTFPVTLRVQ